MCMGRGKWVSKESGLESSVELIFVLLVFSLNSCESVQCH